MPRSGVQLPLQTTSQVKALLEDTNWSAGRIALRVGLSKRTVERIRQSFELFGTPYAPPFARKGRPKALTPKQADMLQYLNEHPTTYIDELIDVVFDEFGIELGETTVKDYLRRHNWSSKVIRREAAQRNALIRAVWATKSVAWKLNELVFIDESASNERTGWRKKGWSPVGLRCTERRCYKRSERWSILPALTLDGYLQDPLVLQGSITKEVFVWWLLNQVIPLLRRGMIIVMDNAAIHHNLGEEVEQALLSKDLRIEYLPPYSPDFNPIETTFHTLKCWIQRHSEESVLYQSFGDFIRKALAESLIGNDLVGYFRKCGYSN